MRGGQARRFYDEESWQAETDEGMLTKKSSGSAGKLTVKKAVSVITWDALLFDFVFRMSGQTTRSQRIMHAPKERGEGTTAQHEMATRPLSVTIYGGRNFV